jgi:AcrR family transcriptional regulator
VRQIAERASIHASMITRYFETKDQLFALASDFPLHLPDLSAFDKSEIGERLSEQFISRRMGGSKACSALPSVRKKRG